MRSLRGMELWVWVSRMTGNGSSYSQQICEELGWPYDMKITPKAILPSRPYVTSAAATEGEKKWPY